MINKTCSIITDSNENYVGIVCEIDEIFMHVQIKNIMFVIPINRIKTVSYGLTHETDLGRRIESETEFSYEEKPVYNSLVANEVNLFSNNTKELGIPILPKVDNSMYQLVPSQESSAIKKILNSKIYKYNVNSQNKKPK